MLRHLVLVTSLVLVPSVAMSQRGGRTQSDKKTDLFDKNANTPTGPALRVRDLEDMSPLKLIIDKRKDLKLTDAQLSSLKDAENKLKDKNASALKAVDSLIREMRSAAAGSSETDRTKFQSAKNSVSTSIDEVYANYQAAAKDAVSALDPDQQIKANELLAKQREDGEKAVREKLNTGGNRRPGDPPLE